MHGIIARTKTLRLWMLFFSLPYGMLWVSASDSGHVHGAGGAITVVLHSLLMLVHFAGSDLRLVRQGLVPRLRVTRSFTLPDPDVLEVARAHLVLTAVVVIAIQSLIAPRVALLALLALGFILLLSELGDARSRRWRYRFAEVIWPIALLVLPMALLASPGADALAQARESGDLDRIASASADLMHDSAIVATCLGALVLCAFVILCSIRDRVQDLGAGIQTVATSLGREGAVAALFAVLIAAVILGNWALSMGAWGWHVPSVVAIGAMVSVWLLAQRDEPAATVFFFATHIAAGILILAMAG